MRVLLSFLAAFFWLNFANADLATLTPECRTKSAEYVHSGPTDTDFVGARLWNFGKLLREQKDSADECLANLKTQSLQEAKDYWRYIGSKYKCVDENFNFPETRPEACAENKWNAVKENFSYISALENGYIPPEASSGGSADAGGSGGSDAGSGNAGLADDPTPEGEPVSDIEAGACTGDCAKPETALATIPPAAQVQDPCTRFTDIPRQFRKSTKASDDLLGATSACLNGAFRSVSALLGTMKGIVDQLASLTEDPQMRAALRASFSDLGRAMWSIAWDKSARDRFKAVFAAMVVDGIKGAWNAGALQLEKEDCMNADGQLAEFCKIVSGGKIVTVAGKAAFRFIFKGLLSAVMRLKPAFAGGLKKLYDFMNKPGAEKQFTQAPKPKVEIPPRAQKRLEGPKPPRSKPREAAKDTASESARTARATVQSQRTEIDKIRAFAKEDLSPSNPNREEIARRILGVDANMDKRSIRAAWIRLQQKVNPSKVDPSLSKEATEAAQLVNAAKDILFNGR